MPVQTTYPGVYINEQISSSPVISGVSTSVTAFVGAARKGLSDSPTAVRSYAEFVRTFGDPIDAVDHPMGYAVAHFFANGGSQAVIVRALAADADPATCPLTKSVTTSDVTVTLTAKSRGEWANGTGTDPSRVGIWVQVTAAVLNPTDRFNLVITSWSAGAGGSTQTANESWPELSMSPSSPRYVQTVLAGSALVTASVGGTPTGTKQGSSTSKDALPAQTAGLANRTLRLCIDQGPPQDLVLFPAGAATDSHSPAEIKDFITNSALPVTATITNGKLVITSDASSADSAVAVAVVAINDASGLLKLGLANGGTEVSGSADDRPKVMSQSLGLSGGKDGSPVDPNAIVSATPGQAMNALDALNFPRFNLLCLPGVTTVNVASVNAALSYCQTQKAFLLVDPDPSATQANAVSTAAQFAGMGQHGALYWPRLITPDSTPTGLPPCGAVAGIMARTDTQRGVWKAPAGLSAGVAGAIGTTQPTSDDVSGSLNPFGINVLRSFPGAGLVVWGARTLAGSDIRQDPFKYVSIRRTTDYIEASLYLGTQFAVFEPNDPVLWGELRLAVGSFMRGLFRQGAFQRSESRAESDSFFVTCDATVNPQSEIDAGRVNIVVGFAPMKPAEFVVITITHILNTGE